jgi:hypothetical protein
MRTHFQIFDSEGHLALMGIRGEPVWKILETQFEMVRPGIATGHNDDFELSYRESMELLRGIEDILRRLAQDIRYVDRPRGYLYEMNVLGLRVTVNLRADDHQTLMRLNELYVGLGPAIGREGNIRVYFLPELSSHAFYLASLVKRFPEGIPKERVRYYLQTEYAQLGNLEIAGEELRSVMEKRAAALNADSLVDQTVTLLSNCGLVRESLDGRFIVPTEKLLSVKL